LLVDDNQDVAQTLADALTILGHEVRVAHDGPGALRLVEKFTPTLALLDIGLPVMDGYELARRLRELPSLAGIRLVAITGYGEAPAALRSVEAGFEAHLVKPVQLERLQEVIAGQAQPSRRRHALPSLAWFNPLCISTLPIVAANAIAPTRRSRARNVTRVAVPCSTGARSGVRAGISSARLLLSRVASPAATIAVARERTLDDLR
jgi:CheY-like chemotaxis protein